MYPSGQRGYMRGGSQPQVSFLLSHCLLYSLTNIPQAVGNPPHEDQFMENARLR